MVLTQKDLLKIYDMLNTLFDQKLENFATKAEFTELSNRIANLEDDVVGIRNTIDTELPIMSYHIKEHTDRLDGIDARLDGIDARLDAIDARLDNIDKFMINFDSRLNHVELAME